MPHQSLRGLKQDAVPNQRHGEGKEHPLREGRQPPPSSPSSSYSDSSRNLWGWPVSQILETDDVRPLIGCLQRRRHQPAALADGTESRTQDDGRTDGGSDGGGTWGKGGSKRWCGGGMPKAGSGGGQGEGLLMSRETALCWGSLHGWQSLLNTNPWEHGSQGGDHIRLQLKGLSFCHRKRRTVERPLCLLI